MSKPPKKRKDPAAVALGRKGGKAKWAAMTPEQRSEHNRAVAMKRWRKEAI